MRRIVESIEKSRGPPVPKRRKIGFTELSETTVSVCTTLDHPGDGMIEIVRNRSCAVGQIIWFLGAAEEAGSLTPGLPSADPETRV